MLRPTVLSVGSATNGKDGDNQLSVDRLEQMVAMYKKSVRTTSRVGTYKTPCRPLDDVAVDRAAWEVSQAILHEPSQDPALVRQHYARRVVIRPEASSSVGNVSWEWDVRRIINDRIWSWLRYQANHGTRDRRLGKGRMTIQLFYRCNSACREEHTNLIDANSRSPTSYRLMACPASGMVHLCRADPRTCHSLEESGDSTLVCLESGCICHQSGVGMCSGALRYDAERARRHTEFGLWEKSGRLDATNPENARRAQAVAWQYQDGNGCPQIAHWNPMEGVVTLNAITVHEPKALAPGTNAAAFDATFMWSTQPYAALVQNTDPNGVTQPLSIPDLSGDLGHASKASQRAWARFELDWVDPRLDGDGNGGGGGGDENASGTVEDGSDHDDVDMDDDDNGAEEEEKDASESNDDAVGGKNWSIMSDILDEPQQKQEQEPEQEDGNAIRGGVRRFSGSRLDFKQRIMRRSNVQYHQNRLTARKQKAHLNRVLKDQMMMGGSQAYMEATHTDGMSLGFQRLMYRERCIVERVLHDILWDATARRNSNLFYRNQACVHAKHQLRKTMRPPQSITAQLDQGAIRCFFGHATPQPTAAAATLGVDATKTPGRPILTADQVHQIATESFEKFLAPIVPFDRQRHTQLVRSVLYLWHFVMHESSVPEAVPNGGGDGSSSSSSNISTQNKTWIRDHLRRRRDPSSGPSSLEQFVLGFLYTAATCGIKVGSASGWPRDWWLDQHLPPIRTLPHYGSSGQIGSRTAQQPIECGNHVAVNLIPERCHDQTVSTRAANRLMQRYQMKDVTAGKRAISVAICRYQGQVPMASEVAAFLSNNHKQITDPTPQESVPASHTTFLDIACMFTTPKTQAKTLPLASRAILVRPSLLKGVQNNNASAKNKHLRMQGSTAESLDMDAANNDSLWFACMFVSGNGERVHICPVMNPASILSPSASSSNGDDGDDDTQSPRKNRKRGRPVPGLTWTLIRREGWSVDSVIGGFAQQALARKFCVEWGSAPCRSVAQRRNFGIQLAKQLKVLQVWSSASVCNPAGFRRAMQARKRARHAHALLSGGPSSTTSSPSFSPPAAHIATTEAYRPSSPGRGYRAQREAAFTLRDFLDDDDPSDTSSSGRSTPKPHIREDPMEIDSSTRTSNYSTADYVAAGAEVLLLFRGQSS